MDDPKGSLKSSGKPNPEQLQQYASALKPCVEKVTEKSSLYALLEEVRAAVPGALKEIQAATPAGAPQLDGKKGGWFGR